MKSIDAHFRQRTRHITDSQFNDLFVGIGLPVLIETSGNL
jgi:hypothetical protein